MRYTFKNNTNLTDDKNVTVTVGGLPTLLLVAFIILKLCNVITWSWVWVLAPLWIPIALGILIFLIVFIGTFLFLKN